MRLERAGERPAPILTILVGALIVGLPLAVFVPELARVIGATGVLAVLVVSFHELARVDRVAFASIAIPTAVAVAVGTVLPWRVALGLDWAVALFFGLFTFAQHSFVPWWWTVALRKPRLGFALALSAHIKEVNRLQLEIFESPNDQWRYLSMEQELRRLRGLRAPTADWASLQSDYATELEDLLALGNRGATIEEYDAFKPRVLDLRSRFEKLLAEG
jgi:hypothetical protein